jgi:hypothetical protein
MAESKTGLSVEQLRRAEELKDVVPETPAQREKTALLIDQSLSLLRNAIAETKTVLPATEFPKDAVPETPFQQEQTASLIEQTLSLVENVAALEPEEPETPSNMQQLVTKQASKDVLPTEPPVQEQQTPSLIDQTLSMVAVAVSESTVTEAPPPSLQQPVAKQISKVGPLIAQALWMVKSVAAEVAPSQPVTEQASKEVAPTDSSVQEERTTSVIGQAQSLVGDLPVAECKEFDTTPSNMQRQPIAKQTSTDVLPATEHSVQQEQTAFAEHAMSLVDNVVIPEPVVNDAPSPSVTTPKALPPGEPPSQDASLVDQTLSFAENVVVHETNSIEVTPQKQLSPKERLDMERAEIQKRVATFKANQQRFQQEREEYYAVTMAKVRATRWTPPNP